MHFNYRSKHKHKKSCFVNARILESFYKKGKKLRKKMKKWQIENSEKSEISEISEKLFRVFLPYSQNRKLGFKNLGKKISEISEISEVSEFSTWPQKASVGLLQVFSQQIFSVNKLYYVVFQSFYCIQLFSAFF